LLGLTALFRFAAPSQFAPLHLTAKLTGVLPLIGHASIVVAALSV
jgi:hypothetical protein